MAINFFAVTLALYPFASPPFPPFSLFHSRALLFASLSLPLAHTFVLLAHSPFLLALFSFSLPNSRHPLLSLSLLFLLHLLFSVSLYRLLPALLPPSAPFLSSSRHLPSNILPCNSIPRRRKNPRDFFLPRRAGFFFCRGLHAMHRLSGDTQRARGLPLLVLDFPHRPLSFFPGNSAAIVREITSRNFSYADALLRPFRISSTRPIRFSASVHSASEASVLSGDLGGSMETSIVSRNCLSIRLSASKQPRRH